MKLSLHAKIFLGLLLGAILGVLLNLFFKNHPFLLGLITYVTEPVGKMWLSALIMVVIPLILSTISLGVAHIGDVRKIGRIGLVTIIGFLILTAISSAFGVLSMEFIRPGYGLDKETSLSLMDTYKGETKNAMGLSTNTFGIDLLIKIIPRNPLQAAASGDMIAVIFFALIIGIAITLIPKEKSKPLVDLLDSIGNVVLAVIDMVMKLAPYAVFCLIFSIMSRFGLGLLYSLFAYVATVLGSMALFTIIVYPLVLKYVALVKPMEFFKKSKMVWLTAFTTSSSNATLPTTIRVAQEEHGISKDIAGFVLPLGATMNMNGTALFEGATILFLAQVFGVPLTLNQQFIVVFMSIITAIGVSGIPGGSLPFIMMILSMLNIPMEGVAIILGVDRILDMCRTTLNVFGDLVVAAVVTRFENATGVEVVSAYSEKSPQLP